MNAEFVRTSFGSLLYGQNLILRERVLRAPLGLSLSSEDTREDAREHHFSAIIDDVVVACVQLRELADGTLKLRQMAVEEKFRGAGIGSGLVRFAEDWAHDAGFSRIMMHARESAIAFYERLGFRTEGDMFLEHTIPHVVMAKALLASQNSD